jgi:hypothetical protein
MAAGSSGDGSSADEAQIEIKDLVTLVAEALRPEGQE